MMFLYGYKNSNSILIFALWHNCCNYLSFVLLFFLLIWIQCLFFHTQHSSCLILVQRSVTGREGNRRVIRRIFKGVDALKECRNIFRQWTLCQSETLPPLSLISSKILFSKWWHFPGTFSASFWTLKLPKSSVHICHFSTKNVQKRFIDLKYLCLVYPPGGPHKSMQLIPMWVHWKSEWGPKENRILHIHILSKGPCLIPKTLANHMSPPRTHSPNSIVQSLWTSPLSFAF